MVATEKRKQSHSSTDPDSIADLINGYSPPSPTSVAVTVLGGTIGSLGLLGFMGMGGQGSPTPLAEGETLFGRRREDEDSITDDAANPPTEPTPPPPTTDQDLRPEANQSPEQIRTRQATQIGGFAGENNGTGQTRGDVNQDNTKGKWLGSGNVSESTARILERFPEKQLSEIYILGDRSKAEEYIKNGSFNKEKQIKLTTELDRMQKEWRENEKTADGNKKNQDAERAFTQQRYNLTEIETHGLPVYSTPEGGVIPFNGKINTMQGVQYDPWKIGKTREHAGIDIKVMIGTPIPAASSGKVIEVMESFANQPGSGGLGAYVRIQHPNGSVSSYGHASSILVKVGDDVKLGDTVILSGNSGNSTGPHLHFEVIDKNKKIINPWTTRWDK